MSRKPIAMIFNGVWSQYAVGTAPKYRDLIDLVYVHDLAAVDWSDYRGVIVPFQTDHAALAAHRDRLYGFLAAGGRVAVFGDAHHWIDAEWADRPVDNHWWTRQPDSPPVVTLDFDHPLFAGLTPRQAGWHHHGVYLRLPVGARVLQRSREDEVVCWTTNEYGGELLAGTQDPIVEHGVQQIRHLDHFVDQLVLWLGGERPSPARLTVDESAYGVPFPRRTRATADARQPNRA